MGHMKENDNEHLRLALPMLAKNPAARMKHVQKALELNPDNVQAIVGLVQQVSKDKCPEAVRGVQRLLKKSGKEPLLLAARRYLYNEGCKEYIKKLKRKANSGAEGEL